MVHDSRCTATILSIATLAVAGAVPLRSLQPVDPNTVRARMHVYLEAYEKELGTLVAEERLTQWPLRGDVFVNGVIRGRRDSSRAHLIESDVAFVSLPGRAGWLGFRDTRRVKGKAIRRTGAPLEDLMKAQSDNAHERAMVLLLESARHNLGAARTINLPSLPLELLHLRNQARFVIEGSSGDRVGDCRAVRLDLTETVRPTIIQRPEGGDMPSQVAAWVEPSTGRLCKAEVKTRDARLGVPPFTAIVTVEFARDARLGLTVPARMEEVFFIAPRGRGEGEATYSNYRRFATSGRLVPPPGAPGR